MSEKTRAKKDGQDKSKENQAMRETNSHSEKKDAVSKNKADNKRKSKSE